MNKPPRPNAICYKVDELVAAIEKSIAGAPFNAIRAVELLHDIRVMAQRMENGLELRKKIMGENNLEEQYKKEKAYAYTPTKLGVNKLKHEKQEATEPLDVEIIIKEKGKVIYQSPAHAVLLASVEEVTDIDLTTGEIYGRTQKVFAGSDVAMLFGYDQLRQAFEPMKAELLVKAKATLLHQRLIDPVYKKRLIDSANNKL